MWFKNHMLFGLFSILVAVWNSMLLGQPMNPEQLVAPEGATMGNNLYPPSLTVTKIPGTPTYLPKSQNDLSVSPERHSQRSPGNSQYDFTLMPSDRPPTGHLPEPQLHPNHQLVFLPSLCMALDFLPTPDQLQMHHPSQGS